MHICTKYHVCNNKYTALQHNLKNNIIIYIHITICGHIYSQITFNKSNVPILKMKYCDEKNEKLTNFKNFL